MPIEFVPFEAHHLEAVRRFNQRMLAGNAATPFLMGEDEPGTASRGSRQVVAVEGGEVRGSFLEVIFPATVCGVVGEAINCQSPLSEGLVDQKYLMLPSQMFKVMLRINPHVFVVGMGSLENPLPRFLKAAGWSVETVPFFYKVARASQFLREIPVLQRPAWKRAAAHLAAITGAGRIAFGVMHRGSASPNLRGWTIEQGEWGSWVTDLWNRFSKDIRFGIMRDVESLPRLYHSSREIGPLIMKRDGVPRAWSMAVLTEMRNNPHFGNLKVATILDCVADSDNLEPAIRKTEGYLSHLGADLIITNQSHAGLQQAFRSAGYRSGPSNYVVAISPKLVAAIGAKPVESGLVYITRADGDGRINL